MDKIKVIFLCGERSPWGYSHLEPLLHEPAFQVVAVVLATEERWKTFRKALSGQDITIDWKHRMKQLVKNVLRPIFPNKSNTEHVLHILEQEKIPVVWCDDANATQAIERFRGFAPDILFSAAYPQIFKAQLLAAFPQGAFNSHPSLLPRCRGAHPVFWAIASGENKSGSTIHIMTPTLDQGNIVAQVEVELLSVETRSRLYANLIDTVPLLLTRFASFLTTLEAKSKPQNDNEATYFRNDRAIHRRIFWSEMSAVQIHNLVRACDGSAYFWYGHQRVIVISVETSIANRNLTNGLIVPAGTVVDINNDNPVVATSNGFITLTKIKTPRLSRFRFGIGMVLM